MDILRSTISAHNVGRKLFFIIVLVSLIFSYCVVRKRNAPEFSASILWSGTGGVAVWTSPKTHKVYPLYSRSGNILPLPDFGFVDRKLVYLSAKDYALGIVSQHQSGAWMPLERFVGNTHLDDYLSVYDRGVVLSGRDRLGYPESPRRFWAIDLSTGTAKEIKNAVSIVSEEGNLQLAVYTRTGVFEVRAPDREPIVVTPSSNVVSWDYDFRSKSLVFTDGHNVTMVGPEGRRDWKVRRPGRIHSIKLRNDPLQVWVVHEFVMALDYQIRIYSAEGQYQGTLLSNSEPFHHLTGPVRPYMEDLLRQASKEIGPGQTR